VLRGAEPSIAVASNHAVQAVPETAGRDLEHAEKTPGTAKDGAEFEVTFRIPKCSIPDNQ